MPAAPTTHHVWELMPVVLHPVRVEPLSIEGSWSFRPTLHGDRRGTFLEWFRSRDFEPFTGHAMALAQANCSVSAAGVLRGVHFADVPPGQAKYVTCMSGAALDVIVDLRVGSPTFGTWDSVLLDDESRNAVYLSEGLGHAFLALDDRTTIVYLCSEPYAPTREHGINPLDEDLAISWPTEDRQGRPLRIELSDKDRDAPSLRQAGAQAMLPDHAAVLAYRRSLAEKGG